MQGIGRSGLGSPCALQVGLVSRSVVRGSGFALCLAGRSGSKVVRSGGSGKSGGGSKVWRQRHLSGHRCVMQACRVLMELHGRHRTATAGMQTRRGMEATEV